MEKKIRKTLSIRTKMTLIMVGLLGFTLVVFWGMNYFFLPNYYLSSKVEMLEKSYYKVNSIVLQDEYYMEGGRGLSSKSDLNIDILSANHTTNIYVFRVTSIMGLHAYSFQYPSANAISENQRYIVEERTKEYVKDLHVSSSWNSSKGGKKNNIESTYGFKIYKIMDQRIGSEYVELFGRLDSGDFVYMRTNFQSMTENVDIFNRFIGYVALGIVAVTMGMMLFFSNNFTKPILQISDIANRMANLDFDVRYPVKNRSDEIGVLGESINSLSDNLQKTIGELKSANNELEKDIQNKIHIDEMRQEFLSNVSHELKTPIALIQGYAEGLQDNIQEDVESRKFYCEVIIDEANKMNKMVKKLLTLNQIEFGKNQIEFQRFDIMQLLEGVVHSATLLAEGKNAKIQLVPSDSIYVWADEYMIEEVVTNFVSNAINHVAEDSTISVSVVQNEGVARISVFNEGEQIAEEEMDKIWVKFYKIDKARTREYGGSGIGLSIVKAIMDSHNQLCGVKNRENGVEFWFELDCHNID